MCIRDRLCTFFPGLIMGWLKYRYQNLFPPALFHFIGNIWSIWFFPCLLYTSRCV